MALPIQVYHPFARFKASVMKKDKKKATLETLGIKLGRANVNQHLETHGNKAGRLNGDQRKKEKAK